jgi:hypothetical protein
MVIQISREVVPKRVDSGAWPGDELAGDSSRSQQEDIEGTCGLQDQSRSGNSISEIKLLAGRQTVAAEKAESKLRMNGRELQESQRVLESLRMWG